MPSARPAPRKRLQFDNPHEFRLPERFMKVDDALNDLGEAERPDLWGITPKFESLPFYLEHPDYFQYIYNENSKEFEIERIEVDETNAIDYFKARLLYQTICNTFIEACEDRQFDAFLIDQYKGIIEFPFTTTVTTQSISIFQTGLAYPPNDQTKLLTVVIDRQGFEKWLSAKKLAEKQQTLRPISESGKNTLFTNITTWAKTRDVLITKPWLLEVVNAASKGRLSKRRIEREWVKIDVDLKVPHRMTTDMAQRLDDLKGEAILVAQLGFEGEKPTP